MKKVSVVIFTYKRALQLDNLLNSILCNFKNVKLPIKIIYQVSEDHKKSYEYLKLKYKNDIEFYERKKNVNFFKVVKLIINPLNLYFYIRFSWLRNYFDNFKFILEKILVNLDTKYVCFLTDDQIIYKKTEISDIVFDLIDQDPKKFSYRFHTGDHFLDNYKIPSNLKINYFYENNKKICFTWDSRDRNCTDLWKYNFHVDATIYDRCTLFKLLKPMIYNMPSTLESIGLWNARIRGYYTICISAVERSTIGIQLNNIQKYFDTPKANYDVDLLKQIYLKGYTIYFQNSDIDETSYLHVPKKLFFINENLIKKEYADFDLD